MKTICAVCQSMAGTLDPAETVDRSDRVPTCSGCANFALASRAARLI